MKKIIGIAVSGSGLGLFVLSPVSELLIREYGWKDTCFIFAAISSHTFISACLFRQPPLESAIEEGTIEKARNKSLIKEIFEIKTKNF